MAVKDRRGERVSEAGLVVGSWFYKSCSFLSPWITESSWMVVVSPHLATLASLSRSAEQQRHPQHPSTRSVLVYDDAMEMSQLVSTNQER